MPRIAVLAYTKSTIGRPLYLHLRRLFPFGSYSDKVTMAKNMAKVLFMGYVPRY